VSAGRSTTDERERQENAVTTSSTNDLDWLLDDLVVRVPDVDKAVILSRDGLAIASGFQSLARGAGRHFGGGHVRQTIVEMDTAFLFVTSAGEGSCLAVLSPASADAGLVAYEMAVLVKRVGQHLSVNPRPTLAGEGTD
jgi:predicted regulator of Ras-like GTPase activity (Roadblock/LC7/MglB family)